MLCYVYAYKIPKIDKVLAHGNNNNNNNNNNKNNNNIIIITEKN